MSKLMSLAVSIVLLPTFAFAQSIPPVPTQPADATAKKAQTTTPVEPPAKLGGTTKGTAPTAPTPPAAPAISNPTPQATDQKVTTDKKGPLQSPK